MSTINFYHIEEFIFYSLGILMFTNLIIGIIQICSALIRYFFCKEKYPGFKDKMVVYLMSVLFYFILLFIFWQVSDVERNMNSYEEILMFYTLILPWPLAIYYWKIVYFN
jgi:hypothetical protein